MLVLLAKIRVSNDFINAYLKASLFRSSNSSESFERNRVPIAKC